MVCIVFLSAHVYAEEDENNQNSEDTQEQAFSEEETFVQEFDPEIEKDIEFDNYVNELFYGEDQGDDSSDDRKSETKPLSGFEALIYNELSDRINQTASGQLSSTIYQIDMINIGIGDLRWTREDLGVDIVVDGAITDEAKNKAIESIADLETVYLTYKHNHPYHLYWVAKGTKAGYGRSARFSASYTNGQYVLRITEGYYLYRFYVGPDYQDGDEFTVKTEIGQSVSMALTNAQNLIEETDSLSDIEKLTAYKEYICENVSYEDAALEDDYMQSNAWQMIWVFDGDPTTNVVCEGYAKAFQYLCDVSDFEKNVTSSIITGLLTHTFGEGGHMWNIVSMTDGNYLVDITNCDEEMVGADDLLFMVGKQDYDTDGSADNGYIYRINYYGTLCELHYEYDEDTLKIYDKKDLTLANHDYNDEIALNGTVILDSKTISMKGDIGIVFCLDIPAAIKDSVYVHMNNKTYPSYGETVAAVSGLTPNPDTGFYEARKNVPIAHGNDEVNITVTDAQGNLLPFVSYYGDDLTAQGYDFSVSKYIEGYRALPAQYQKPNVLNFLNSIENYMNASRIYFNYDVTEGLSVDHTPFTDFDISDYESYEMVCEDSLDGIERKGSTLVLDDATSIRHRFKLTEGSIDDYTFTVSAPGKNQNIQTQLRYESSSDTWLFYIRNVTAKELDRPFTLTITRAGEEGSLVLTYSGLTYAYRSFTGQGTALDDIIMTMCKYNADAQVALGGWE